MEYKVFVQIFLIVVMLLSIGVVYQINIVQITKKKKMIEQFVEKVSTGGEPEPFTRDDFSIYSNVIGVFKSTLGKEPTSDELYACYLKINSKEMSLAELETLLINEPTNYRVFLFPEADKLLIDEKKPANEINKMQVSDEFSNDEKLTSNIESTPNEEIRLTDKGNSVQYIINRPTIYNIGTSGSKKAFDVTTEESINSLNKIIDQKNNDDDSIDEEEEDTINEEVEGLTENFELFNKDHVKRVKDVEKNKKLTQNRCLTQDEFDDQNKYASQQQTRNMNELKFGCTRSKQRTKIAHTYDDMVLRHDQLWRMPEKKPPVCTKGNCSVNPMQVQSSLIGTLISDSEDTQIGSIMPGFKYNEQ
jgi:NACalpha-BTF3-like transcription factor